MTTLHYVAILLGIINLFSTVYLWRKGDYSRTQKFIQTVIIWAIPALGAILISGIQRCTVKLPSGAGEGYPKEPGPIVPYG